MTTPIPALPAQGSTAWYSHYSALDANMRVVAVGTSSGAFSMGGCVGFTGNLGAGAANERSRVQFPVTPTRFRFRFRNANGLAETAGTSNFTINGGAIGVESAATDGSFAATPTLTFTNAIQTTTGVTAEYVSPWITNDGSIKANTPLLFSFGLAYAGGTLSTTNAQQAWVGYSDGTSYAAIAAQGALGNFSFLEKIIEYEFESSLTRTVMFVGDSLTDTYSGSQQAGWYGQVSGYPNKWARAHRNVAVVNAFTSAKTGDFGSSSNKWSRFPTITAPDAIHVAFGTNDIASYTPTSGSLANFQTGLLAILTKLRSLYPNAPIYLTTIMPTTGITADTSNPTQESVRQQANAWLFTLGTNLGVAGVHDFDRAVRSSATVVDTQFASGDGIHLNPRGWDKQADVIRIK